MKKEQVDIPIPKKVKIIVKEELIKKQKLKNRENKTII